MHTSPLFSSPESSIERTLGLEDVSIEARDSGIPNSCRARSSRKLAFPVAGDVEEGPPVRFRID